jgi:alkyl sulfatase BDS1-like metallo-beta-lactamase superfamily hydrolase
MEIAETGIRMPTHTFSGRTTLEVGGTTIELVEAHGETHDQLFIWLPDRRALLPGDNIYYAFPNLYTIRGTTPRPVGAWIASLDAMRRYQPEWLIPSHTSWLGGSQAIADLLRDYRDGIQWVRDHVVRGANDGLSLDEIVATVGLPPHLRAQPALQELYGQLDWSARAIFTNELGWFDGEAADLYGPAAPEAAGREIALMGGPAAVAEAAAAALADGDPHWAAHLYRKLLTAGGAAEAVGAWQAGLADALAASAAAVANSNGRAYLLERAWELRNGGYVPPAPPRIGDVLLREIPLDAFFEAMSMRLIPEQAVDVHESVVFDVPGEGRRYVLTVRRGIAELSIGDALPGTPEPLATVTVDGLTWRRLALQIDGPAGALARGDLKIAGNRLGFLRFIDRFKRGL